MTSRDTERDGCSVDEATPGPSTSADPWLEQLEQELEQDDEVLMDVRDIDEVSHPLDSGGTDRAAGPSLLERAAALRPEDAPMQLDGEHWTVVDMQSPRFQRTMRRNQLTAEEQLQHMSYFGGAQVKPRGTKPTEEQRGPAVLPVGPPRELETPSETVTAVHHMLNTLSSDSDSEEDPAPKLERSVPRGEAVDYDRPKHCSEGGEGARHAGKKRRSPSVRPLVDEVTEEENKSLDGPYWQIVACEPRTKRLYKRRAAELPSDELVLVGSGNYGEKKRRAQQQMKELKLRQTLMLSRKQLFHFGDYMRDLSVVLRGSVPQFLRIYQRSWKRSPAAFLARLRKGAHHFSFVREYTDERMLEEKDAIALRCLLQALQEASNPGGAQGGVTKSAWNYFESQEEIFGESQDDDYLELLEDVEPMENGPGLELDRSDGIARPPKKQQKTTKHRKEPAREMAGPAAAAPPAISSREEAVRRHQQKGRSFLEASRLAGAYGTAAPPAHRRKRSSSADKGKGHSKKGKRAAQRSSDPASSGGEPVAKRVRRSSSMDKPVFSSTAGKRSVGDGGGRRRKQTAPTQRGYKGVALSSTYDLAKPKIARPSTMSDADYARSLKIGSLVSGEPTAASGAMPSFAATPQTIDLVGSPDDSQEDFDGCTEEPQEFSSVLPLPHPKPSIPHRFAYPATITFPPRALPDVPSPPIFSSGPSLPLSTEAMESTLIEAIPQLLPTVQEWGTSTESTLRERIALLEGQLRDAHSRAGSAVDWLRIGTMVCSTLQLTFPDVHQPLAVIFGAATASRPPIERAHGLRKSATILVAIQLRTGLLGLLAAMGDHCSGLHSRLCQTLLAEHIQLMGKCRWAFGSPGVDAQESSLLVLGRKLVATWPGGMVKLWMHVNEMVKGWTTLEDALHPSMTLSSLTSDVEEGVSEFHESQLMVDFGDPTTAADKKALQGEHEDLTEIAWQVLFHFTCLDGSASSNWELVEHLVVGMRDTRLLSSRSIPEQFREDLTALLDEDGKPRRWLQNLQDAQVVTEVLRRLVALTRVWDTAADERRLASIVKLFVAHFQVIQFNDNSNSFPVFLSSEDGATSLQGPRRGDLPFVLLLKVIHNHLRHLTSVSSPLSPVQQQKCVLRLASSLFVSLVPAQPHIIRDWGDYGGRRRLGASRSNVRNCMSLLITMVGFSSGDCVCHILDRIVDIVNFTESEVRARKIVMEGVYLALLAKYRLLVPLGDAEENTRRELEVQVRVIVGSIGQLRAVLLKEHCQLLNDGASALERKGVELSIEFELDMLQVIAASRQKAVSAIAKQLALSFSSSVAPPRSLLPLSMAPLVPLDVLEHIFGKQWNDAMPTHLRTKALQALLTLLRNDPLPPLPSDASGPPAVVEKCASAMLTDTQSHGCWDLVVSDEELLAMEQRISTERLRESLGAELAAQAVAVGTTALGLLPSLMQFLEVIGVSSAPQGQLSEASFRKQQLQLFALSCHCVGSLAAVALINQQSKSPHGAWSYYFARFGASSAESAGGRPQPLQLFVALLERLQNLQELGSIDAPPPPEEELLSVWFQGMCLRKYSVQHRLMRSLLLLCNQAPLLAACLAKPLSLEHRELLDLSSNQEAFFKRRSKTLAAFVSRAAAKASSNVKAAEKLRKVFDAAPPYIAGVIQESAAAASHGLELKSATAHVKLCFRLVATLCELLPQLLYKTGSSSRALPAIAERVFLSTELDRHLQGSFLRQLLFAISTHHSGGDMYLLRVERSILSHWESVMPARGRASPLVEALASDTLPAAYVRHWLRDVVAPAITDAVTTLQALCFATRLLRWIARRASFRDEALLLLPATVAAFPKAKARAGGPTSVDIAFLCMELWYNLFVVGRRHDFFGEELLLVTEREGSSCCSARAFASLLAALLAAEVLLLARLRTQAAVEFMTRAQEKLKKLGIHTEPCQPLTLWTSGPQATVGKLASKAFSCLLILSLAGATGLREVLRLLPLLHKEFRSVHTSQQVEPAGVVLSRFKAFLRELGNVGQPYLNSLSHYRHPEAQHSFLGL